MLDYRQLEALSALIEEGTFLKASKRLGLTQPAVTERIRLLEDSVGKPLVVRSNPVKATVDGQRLISHLRQVRLMESGVYGELGLREEVSKPTLIPIAVNFDSLATWFVPAVTDFLKAEKCQFQISAADQRVTIDQLRKGRVLACVSFAKAPISGCTSDHIGTLTYVSVCSKTFYQRYFGTDKKLANLLEAPAITYGSDDYLHDEYLGQILKKDYPAISYGYAPQLGAMKEMIYRGLAYGLLPEIAIRKELESGQFVEITPGRRLKTELYWHATGVKSAVFKKLGAAVITNGRKLLK